MCSSDLAVYHEVYAASKSNHAQGYTMALAADVITQAENAFFPVFTRHDIVVARADGWRVWNADGREYLDLTSGWGVTCLGHCHPPLVDGITRQLNRCLQAPNCNLSYTPIQAEAAERLVRAAPSGMTRVFFTNSGTRSEEHTSELQSQAYLVCRLLL